MFINNNSMKIKTNFFLSNLLTALFVCFSATIVFAQESDIANTADKKTEIEKPVIKDLNLSQEQIDKLAEIKNSISIDRNELKAASGKDREVAVKMTEDYQQKMMEAFKEVLTEAQYEQYQQNLKAIELPKISKPKSTPKE